MNNQTELSRRQALTFEQAEGLEELPRQLLPDEMPDVLKARLLHVIVKSVEKEMAERNLARLLGEAWEGVFRRFYVEFMGDLSVEFDKTKTKHLKTLELFFKAAGAKQIYGIMQALVRLADLPSFSEAVADVLEREHSAYRLLEGGTLVPVGSPEEAANLAHAITKSKQSGLVGASAHLTEAAKQLSSGAFADSVRESLHAVESTLRSLAGTTKVSDALSELAKKRPLHPAFTSGIKQLYGFASDEPGVRHPLLEKGDAAVTEEDALLMLGTCASLVTYFTRSFSKA